MNILQKVGEEEMIANFLKAEINSRRWSDHVANALHGFGLDRRIVDNPNLKDADENTSRKSVLASYRGYGRNQYLFTGFPNDVSWQRVCLDREDLLKCKYVKSNYWLEATNNSVFVRDAVQRINAGTLSGSTLQDILAVAALVESGQHFPKVILVALDPSISLITLEGNTRITAFLLCSKTTEVTALVGTSSQLSAWIAKWQ